MSPLTSTVLGADEREAFLRDGFVVVRQVFPREVAAGLQPPVWDRLDGVTSDPSTWTSAALQVEDVITDGPVDGIFTERFRRSVDELVGPGRWFTRHGYGWVVLRFPLFRGPWRAPDSGWHVDGVDFRHHLDSPEQGLAGLELLTDVRPGGGGTVVRPGSHVQVARLLHAAGPDGITYPELRRWCDEQSGPAREIVGEAGDVLWMHPHLMHARGPNTGDTVRIAANRCIRLHAAMVLDRSDVAAHSLVEQAIRLALG